MCEFIGTETNRCEALEQVKIERDNLVATITTLRRDIDEAKDWLKEARKGWSGSDAEFSEAYGELCEMLGLELTEDVDVELTLSVNIRVRRPIGVTLDDANDFWFTGRADFDSNYEVLETADIVVDEASE